MFNKKIINSCIAAIVSFFMIVTVVGCKNNFLNNPLGNKPFTIPAKANLKTWLPADIANNEEIKVLADLFSPLIGVDKYNRNFGDIFYQSNKTKSLVGEVTDNFKKWTYYVNPNGIQEQHIRKWYNYKGEVMRKITANDVINTLKYALYPYNINANSSYLWDKINRYTKIQKHFKTQKKKISWWNTYGYQHSRVQWSPGIE